MIFIDGDTAPTINGTGTEDYYNGAWDFGGNAFAQPAPGRALHRRPGADRRPLLPLPLAHREPHHLREIDSSVTIEHGHANDRADDFYSVAYWYQTEPHAEFPRLPPPEARIPKVIMSSSTLVPHPCEARVGKHEPARRTCFCIFSR